MKIVRNKPTITRDDLESVLDSLLNEQLDTETSLRSFESSVASLTGQKYPLATNSSTSAYHLAYSALGIDESHEVIIPAYFNQAPLSALNICRGRPIFVDNEKDSIFPSINSIKNKITDRTRAIITGHTFGFHCDIQELGSLNIPVIEDISQAIGTSDNGTPIGSRGTFAIASFASSMMITTGNGGIVLTKNSKYYTHMKQIRGSKDDQLSLDYKMTDFQGAMGLTQLSKLKKLLKRRREIAQIYQAAIRHSPHTTPFPYSEDFAYQSFPIIFDSLTEKVEKFWKKNRIEVIRPIRHPLYTLNGKSTSDYPICSRLSKKLYTLPIYPTLTKKQIERISKALAAFI